MAEPNVITLSNQRLMHQLAWLGYPCASDRLNILGIRGAERVSDTSVRFVENVPDRYNDSIVLFGTTLRVFRASVDPGAHYTANPLNPQGCANLKNGSYLYVKGLHRNSYQALRQAAGADGQVTVWRDRDEDHQRDADEIEQTGHFGINIHAGGTSDRVGRNSAGCQVIWGGRGRGSPWLAFMALIDAAASRTNANRQRHFRYVLVDAGQLLPLAVLWRGPGHRLPNGELAMFA
jgi:hypothetical protein